MRKVLIIGGLIAAVFFMALIANKSGDKAIEMRIENAAVGSISKSVMASGSVNYRQNVALRTEVTGQITEILVEEGQRVNVGDPLLKIDPTVFQANVEQYKAAYEMRQINITRQEVLLSKLTKKLDRQRKLYDRKVIGEDLFENIEKEAELAHVDLKSRKSELRQGKASYDQALDRLKKTVIRAPIDGIVTGLEAKVGETVVEGRSTMVGSNLMNVSDPSEIIAEIEVEETGILEIKVGQSAKITTAADPNGFEMGVVTHIGTTARKKDTNSNSFLVKLSLNDSSPEQVRLGLSCRAEIFTDTVEKALSVPVEAILHEKDDEKSAYLFVFADGKAIKTKVEVGIQNDIRSEIKAGLKMGDKLIAGPYRLLKTLQDGANVKPVKDKAADTAKEET